MVAIAAGCMLVAGAMPAFAHASFPTATAFGFAPNSSGGTGAVGSTPPYTPGSTPTLYLRVPFEQTEPFNGSDDTTVDVKAIVPAGWTNPACGAAKKQINTAATNNTNQPGTDAAGWACEILDVSGHKVVHWSGPQVVSPQTSNDSAQFYVFSVTTPSPGTQTAYNGTGGTEGFIVDQTYASGEAEHWIPNAEFPGTPPAGSTTSVATGLVRSVAGVEVDTTTTTSSSTSTTTTTPGTTSTTAPQSTTTTSIGGSGTTTTTVGSAGSTTTIAALGETTTSVDPDSTTVAAAATGSGTLPFTGGGSTSTLIGVGGACLASGLALVLRRRRAATE